MTREEKIQNEVNVIITSIKPDVEIEEVEAASGKVVKMKVSYHRGLRCFNAYDNGEGQPLVSGWTHSKAKMRQMLASNPDNYRVCECHLVGGWTRWILGSEWLSNNPA